MILKKMFRKFLIMMVLGFAGLTRAEAPNQNDINDNINSILTVYGNDDIADSDNDDIADSDNEDFSDYESEDSTQYFSDDEVGQDIEEIEVGINPATVQWLVDKANGLRDVGEFNSAIRDYKIASQINLQLDLQQRIDVRLEVSRLIMTCNQTLRDLNDQNDNSPEHRRKIIAFNEYVAQGLVLIGDFQLAARNYEIAASIALLSNDNGAYVSCYINAYKIYQIIDDAEKMNECIQSIARNQSLTDEYVIQNIDSL